LIAGLIGGAFGFALTRAYPPEAKPAPPPVPQASEARAFADDLVRLLKSAKYDEFFTALRPGFANLTDKEFQQLRESVIGMRQTFAKSYGGSGEFEFAGETALSPSLVRVSFVERYERGCVFCVLIVYNSPGGWRFQGFSYQPPGAALNIPR
jgi:hypothetical protein